MSLSLISLMNAAPPHRRLIAGTLLLVIIVPGIFLFLTAMARFSYMRANIQALREEQYQIQTVIDRARLQAANPMPQNDGNSPFIGGDSLSVVQANLYQALNQTAQSSGATITSISSLPSQQRDDLNYVGIRMDIEGTMASVHETVRRIEAMVPALIVEKAQLHATSRTVEGDLSEPVSVAGQLILLGALDPSVSSIESNVQ